MKTKSKTKKTDFIKHQQIIQSVITGMNIHLIKNEYVGIMVTNEIPLIHNNSTKIPDIVVWNEKNNHEVNPLLVIEVCKQRYFDGDIKKVTALMNSYESLKEGFVYNFDKQEWYKISRRRKEKPSLFKNESNSKLYGIDFAKLIN